jgi:hypothetical protein
MPKAAVKASKVIAGSKVTTQILDEYDLDLTQLAVIAKFDGNQARVDELVRKARNRWGVRPGRQADARRGQGRGRGGRSRSR